MSVLKSTTVFKVNISVGISNKVSCISNKANRFSVSFLCALLTVAKRLEIQNGLISFKMKSVHLKLPCIRNPLNPDRVEYKMSVCVYVCAPKGMSGVRACTGCCP